MPEYEEPRPPKPQLSGEEQDRIINAILETLSPDLFSIRPNPDDALNLADYLRVVIYDRLRDRHAVDGVLRLIGDAGEAGLIKLHEIMAERDSL